MEQKFNVKSICIYNPLDVHKINASLRFQLGVFKLKSSLSLNKHIFDEMAKARLEKNQPLDRFKLALSSKYLDFKLSLTVHLNKGFLPSGKIFFLGNL